MSKIVAAGLLRIRFETGSRLRLPLIWSLSTDRLRLAQCGVGKIWRANSEDRKRVNLINQSICIVKP